MDIGYYGEPVTHADGAVVIAPTEASNVASESWVGFVERLVDAGAPLLTPTASRGMKVFKFS